MAEIVEKPKPLTAQDIGKRFFRQENAALAVVLAALIGGMGVITHGLTTSRSNMMNILLQSSIRGVAAVGQAFVILTAGIDISVGGVALVSSLLGASLMTKAPYENIIGYPAPFYVGIAIMLLVGSSWGILNGLLVSRVGMPALIVTLGMWEITKGVAFQVGHGRTISNQPDVLAFFGSGTIAGIPTPVIIFVVVAIIAYFVLNYTAYGRFVYAVGGNPVSASLAGINIKNILHSVYIISGFLAGLASVILTARVMSASMRTLGGLELDSIAAATVGGVSLFGGKGSIIGVVFGVLIIGVVNNGMSVLGASPATQGIAKGAIIISAVASDVIRRR